MSIEGAEMFRSPTLKRDRWDRPLIMQPDGKEVAYTRASTIAKALDSGKALGDWKARQAAKGVALNIDLISRMAALDLEDEDQKKEANKVVEMAMERTGSSRKREMGTAFHAFAEQHDLGQKIPYLPPELHEAMTDYVRQTAGVEWLGVEKFVVNDLYQVAGTADRFGRLEGEEIARVWDMKTGRVDYGSLSFSMQLAAYASGEGYDPQTGKRVPLGYEVAQDYGIIVHVDVAAGRVGLHKVDLAVGREAVEVAIAKRRLEKEAKEKMSDFATTIGRIFRAESLEALNELYQETQPWSDRAKKAADLRVKELRGE